MIIYSNQFVNVRHIMIKVVSNLSKDHKLKILDLGGGKNSYLREFVTDVIDLYPNELVKSHVTFHQSDIYDEKTWKNFKPKQFDIISCTQTLEDLRDPKYIINKISKYSKCGFITVPNQFQETSLIESNFWLGNYHHRWIFTFTKDGFYCIPKYSYLNRFSVSIFFSFLSKFIFFSRGKIPNQFPILRKSKVRYKRGYYPLGNDELTLIYVNGIDLEYYNGDHPGKQPKDSMRLLNKFLAYEFSDIGPRDLDVLELYLTNHIREALSLNN